MSDQYVRILLEKETYEELMLLAKNTAHLCSDSRQIYQILSDAEHI